MPLKLLSWNVNGIRAVLRRDGFAFLEDERPDILCLQEVRATPEQAGPVLPRFQHQFWNPAPRPGPVTRGSRPSRGSNRSRCASGWVRASTTARDVC